MTTRERYLALLLHMEGMPHDRTCPRYQKLMAELKSVEAEIRSKP